jgi:hypothetical protein
MIFGRAHNVEFLSLFSIISNTWTWTDLEPEDFDAIET